MRESDILPAIADDVARIGRPVARRGGIVRAFPEDLCREAHGVVADIRPAALAQRFDVRSAIGRASA